MSETIQHYLADFKQLQNIKKDDWFSKQRQSAFNIFKNLASQTQDKRIGNTQM